MIPHLYTADLQSTISYYTNVLAFELVLPPGELDEKQCMVRLGDASIIFEEIDNYEPMCGWGRLHLFVDDILPVFHTVSDFADVVENPHATEQGTYEFVIRDRNGIELVFSQIQPIDVSQLSLAGPDPVGRGS